MTEEPTKQTVAVYTSHADFINTAGKNVWLGLWLKQAGYEVIMLCWDDGNAKNFSDHKLPYVMLKVEEKSADLNAIALELDSLLNIPAVEGTRIPAPTIGRLLAYDDFLGCGRVYALDGAGAIRFDCLVSTMPPAEFTVKEDSLLSLQLWRYVTHHHIPNIGIECSPLDNDTLLTQWPVDLLLTKQDPRLPESEGWKTHPRYDRIAPEVFQMNRATRYALSLSHDPISEELYKNHKIMLEGQLQNFGARFLYLPFHLSYKERAIELLNNLEPYREDLMDSGFALVLSCDSRQYRRLLTEQDMVNVGLLRWLDPWRRGEQKRFAVVEGPPMLWLMDMASAILAPCESLATEWARQWGVPIVRPGEEVKIADLSLGTSVVEAVKWALEGQVQGEA